MADLKSGTTVGGNTIWSQGNLALVPAGNSITYRNYKIYTENDKPTPAEVGLGNVTNDAQVKKSGDTMTGALAVNTDVTVGYRLLLLRKSAGSAPFVVGARSDNNPINTTFPTGNTEVLSIHARTTSNDTDPMNGAGLVSWRSYQKGVTGGGLGLITTYASPTVVNGAIVQGAVTAELVVDADAAQVRVSKGAFLADKSTLGDTTVASLTTSGQITSTAGKLNLTGRNAGIEIGSTTESGVGYIDFHTSGAPNDFDFRLSVNTNGFVFDSNGTDNFDIDMTKTRYLALSNTGTSGIKGKYGNIYIRDTANGNVVLSASRANASDTVGGALYLGYNNPDAGHYTSSVRLDSPMNWKGTNVLVNGAGKLVSTELDGGPVLSSYIRGSGFMELINADPSNPAVGSFINTGEIRSGWTTRGADNNGHSRGYVSFYGQEQVGTAWRACISVVGYTNAPTWQFNQTGEFRSPGSITCDVADSYRIRSNGTSIFHRFDGTNWYFMLSDSADGTWNSLRPLTIHKPTGNVQMGHQLNVSGNIVSANELHAYNGNVRVATDGNVSGSRWGGWLFDWINNNPYARANDAWNKANDAQQSRVYTGRRGGQQYQGGSGNGQGMTWESPVGCFLTGINTNVSDGRGMGVYFRRLQMQYGNGGWFEIGD